MATGSSVSACIVIGGGPAGLAAAEVLGAAGCRVDLYDAMPSCGRKFLLAGRGGLNLTHAEPYERFVTRFHPLPPLLRFQPPLSARTPEPPPRISLIATPATSASASLAKVTRRPLIMAT